MDVYEQIAVKIIAGQETIIGPVAVEQAQQVRGLDVQWAKHEVSIGSDGAGVINELVAKYKALFGQISVEVCKEATAALVRQLAPDEVPEALR